MAKLVEALGLPGDEIDHVGNCIEAIAEGPFIDSDEFRTVMGFDRSELQEFLQNWPDVESNDDAFSIVNNALLNLVAYPHSYDGLRSEMTHLNAGQIADLLEKIRRRARQAGLLDSDPRALSALRVGGT